MNLYEPTRGQEQLYPDEYFATRLQNDPKRQKQFQLERDLIYRFIRSGAILDVGCSTGEFLQSLSWNGEMYGMEISAFARRHAEAASIRFDRDLFNSLEYFDCIVFRGTIQHIDEPFRFMKYSYRALRNGGYLFFLATPNINSLVYRLKKASPLLDPSRNFYFPDDVTLPNTLRNFGFIVHAVNYPYRETPYCRFWSDHLRFLQNIFSKRFYPHAFWRNSMEIVAQKPTPSIIR